MSRLAVEVVGLNRRLEWGAGQGRSDLSAGQAMSVHCRDREPSSECADEDEVGTGDGFKLVAKQRIVTFDHAEEPCPRNGERG